MKNIPVEEKALAGIMIQKYENYEGTNAYKNSRDGCCPLGFIDALQKDDEKLRDVNKQRLSRRTDTDDLIPRDAEPPKCLSAQSKQICYAWIHSCMDVYEDVGF